VLRRQFGPKKAPCNPKRKVSKDINFMKWVIEKKEMNEKEPKDAFDLGRIEGR
jgi:hypothetical protein